jgi:hypothetical protein
VNCVHHLAKEIHSLLLLRALMVSCSCLRKRNSVSVPHLRTSIFNLDIPRLLHLSSRFPSTVLTPDTLAPSHRHVLRRVASAQYLRRENPPRLNLESPIKSFLISDARRVVLRINLLDNGTKTPQSFTHPASYPNMARWR